MESTPIVSAIVVVVDGDVHSVYMIPCKEAVADNMSKLRTLRDKLLNKHGLKNTVRIQRVWMTNDDRNASTFDDVSKQLENVIDSLNF